MFIVVNQTADYGIDELGRFATHDEAFKLIAENVKYCYGFDLMNVYPFDDNSDSLRYKDDNIEVWADDDWCTCHHRNFSDHYLIIEA